MIYFIYLALFVFTSVVNYKLVKRYFFLAIISLAILLPFQTFRQIPLATFLSIPFIATLTNSTSNQMRKILIGLTMTIGFASILINLYINPIGISNEEPFKPLISYIKDHHLMGRVFNDQQIGAYLSYYLYPQVLVSYDTRDDLFIGTPFLRDSQNLPLNIVINKYRPDFLVLKNPPHLNNWQTVFQYGDFLIILPQSPK